MTPSDFGKLIKNDFHGVFFFYGDEQYLKQHYTNLVKKSIFPGEENVLYLSGEDRSLSDLCHEAVEASSMLSMDLCKRLVVIRDVDWKKVSKSDLEDLEDCAGLLKEYEDVAVIIDGGPCFDAGNPPKRPSKIFSAIEKLMPSVNFAKEPPAKLAVWAQKHFAAYGLDVPSDVCAKLVGYCGRDMITLNNEITKLSAYTLQKGAKTVSESDIRTVSSQNDEIDTFDFSNAILNGDFERAFAIMSDMRLRREAPEMILGGIMRVYSDLYSVKCLAESGALKNEIAKRTKMHEYKAGLYYQRANSLSRAGLEKAVSLCHEADLKIKSTGLDSYDVLDVLLIKLSMTGRIR